MNSFKTLFKYNLINSLGINKLKKKKNSNLGVGALAAIIYLAIFAFVTFYMFLFVMMFKELSDAKDLFLFIIFVSSIICFFSTISKANTYLFRTKDYDFLMSLPIKTSAIIVTKLLSLYVYNLLFVFTLVVSSDIAYFISCGFDVYILAMSLVGIITIPFIPMVVSSVLSFLLGFIPVNQKIKNIIMMIIYVILFGGFMIIYFLSIQGEGGNVASVYLSLSQYYICGKWLFDGFTKNSISNFLLYLGISILLMVLFVTVISLFFLKINGAMSRSRVKSNYKLNEEKFTSTGATKAIFKKELRMLINAPQVLIQILSSPLMSLIAVIVLSIMSRNSISLEDSSLPFDGNTLLLLFSVLVCFTLTMVSTTSSTISLEGKSFWIIKSSPVPALKVLKAKCFVNFLFTMPIALFNIIFITIFYKANIILGLLSLLFVVLYVMFSTFIGLLFNLKHYKFDYDNPVKAVKQGKAVLYTMLVDMLGTIIVGLLMILGNYFGGIYVCILVGIVSSGALAFLTLHLLTTNGVENYEKITA